MLSFILCYAQNSEVVIVLKKVHILRFNIYSEKRKINVKIALKTDI